MRIEWAIPCEHAEIENNVGTFVGVSIDRFKVGPMPRLVIAQFGCSFAIPPVDAGTEQTVVATTFSPELEQVGRVSQTLRVPDQPHPIEGWERHRLHVINVQIQAEQPGPYMVEWQTQDNSIQVPLLLVE